MAQTVTVLGFNGRVGQAVTRAFVAAGWDVTGMGRGNRAGIEGMRYIEGSASNPEDVRRACEGSEVVVNAINLPYDKWANGNAERSLQSVLDGLKGSGKTMLFPGNIYNFSAEQHLITPDTPQQPEKDKGEIRKRMEEMLAAASNEDNMQIVIIRSADFYGPYATETNFDLSILTRIKSNVLQYPGDLDMGHSWAYLPDLGRAYVKVAEARESLPQFENFQFEGHYATGHELIAMVQKALPKPAKVAKFPWWLLRILSIFMPVMREVVKMSYLWRVPHRLRDDKLSALLGPEFHTPMADAVAKTTRSYLPGAESNTP